MTTYRSKLRQMIIRLKTSSLWEVCDKQELPLNLCIVWNLLWTANAQGIRLMGYSSMSHTSWWSAQNDKYWIHALITKQSEWSHKIDRIISSNMHKCSLWSDTWSSMSHKHSISTKSKQSLKNHQIKQERIKATLSLEAYDLYIFLPLWQQVTKKFIENA